MRLDRHRRPLAAIAVLAAVLTAGACGTSFSAQTNQQYQSAIGADLRSDAVHVLHALLVTNSDGSATLSATLVNKTDSDQRLASVTLTDGEGNEFELDSPGTDDLVISPNQARTLGAVDSGAQALNSKVYTTTGVEDVGLYFTLTLTFVDAGEFELTIPSVLRNQMYAEVALPPGADPAENSIVPGDETMELNDTQGSSSSGH